MSEGFYGKAVLEENAEPLLLEDGKPTEDEVAAENYQYFMFVLTEKNVDLTFSLTALSGDPDIFVGIGDDEQEEIKNPTKESYTYSAKVCI